MWPFDLAPDVLHAPERGQWEMPMMPHVPVVSRPCDHCFCTETAVNLMPHGVCCNCGTKKAKGPLGLA